MQTTTGGREDQSGVGPHNSLLASPSAALNVAGCRSSRTRISCLCVLSLSQGAARPGCAGAGDPELCVAASACRQPTPRLQRRL